MGTVETVVVVTLVAIFVRVVTVQPVNWVLIVLTIVTLGMVVTVLTEVQKAYQLHSSENKWSDKFYSNDRSLVSDCDDCNKYLLYAICDCLVRFLIMSIKCLTLSISFA